MSTSKGIWFVYRSPLEGPLGKRVCRLDAPSILAWFQEKLADARGAAAPREVADAELGGPVHGFGALLAAAKQHKLAAPKSTAALRALLHKHLPAVGGPEGVRLDDHTLRVLADAGDGVAVYCFFDDEAQREHAERIAWLLEEDYGSLLDDDLGGDDDGAFTPPVSVCSCGTPGDGDGATYACLVGVPGRGAVPGAAIVIPGVRLPGLPAHLRRPAQGPEAFPLEVGRLRELVERDDATLAPALRRAGALVGKDRAPEEGVVHEGEHVAILCAPSSPGPGWQQWFFFDDRWAAVYPDLAGSLLRYTTEWDPFPGEDVDQSLHERAYLDAVEGRGGEGARRYRPAERFGAGELLEHAKFGLGVVKRAEVTKIEVIFRDCTRTLAHGAG